jgi:hypothetical protein
MKAKSPFKMTLELSNAKTRLLCCGHVTWQRLNSNKMFHSGCDICQTMTHGSVFKGKDDYEMNCLIKAKEN